MRTACLAAAATLVFSTLAAQQPPAPAPPRPPVIGTWDLTIHTPEGRHLPSWLDVRYSGNRVLVGRMVGVVGSVRPISRLDFAHDTLKWSLPPQWEPGDGDFQYVAVFAGDSLTGSMTTSDGKQLTWSGHRAPALHRTRGSVVQWGTAVPLFNGRDITGWHVVGGDNQWKGVAGVLTNTQRGGNLVTDGTYGDFKLHVEFKYPPTGNSGVYLRGRYEAQIEDSVESRAEATGGLGAIYGFLIPNENAAKGANEWQTYDITLVGRMVTVVLNGKEVVCRANIPGPTGGALDSNEEKPGPIMLQGDHGPVEYRNLTITPAR